MRRRGVIVPAQLIRRLRGCLLVFVGLLLVPVLGLILRTQHALDQENYLSEKNRADEIVRVISEGIVRVLKPEELRPTSDYQFFTFQRLLGNEEITLSPLAKSPTDSTIPALLGYFQLKRGGQITTPLLPDNVTPGSAAENQLLALDPTEVLRRREVLTKLTGVLEGVRFKDRSSAKGKNDGRGVQSAKPAKPQEAAGATLGAGFAEESSLADSLQLDTRYWSKEQAKLESADKRAAAPPAEPLQEYRKRRSEKGMIPDPKAIASGSYYRNQAFDLLQRLEGTPSSAPAPAAQAPARQDETLSFERSVDPLQVMTIDTDHVLFFRKVWEEQQPSVQGFVVEAAGFFNELVGQEWFRASRGSKASLRVVRPDGSVIIRYDAGVAVAHEANEILLHRSTLPAPLTGFQMLISTAELPPPPGARVVELLSVVILLVLLGGSWVLYALGKRHIALLKQQNDFVSAVSHELKTPLTSIRMYAELLREGWTLSEEKRASYYEFIFGESERLSRLIGNVLELARLGTAPTPLEVTSVRAGTLIDLVRSSVESQVQRAGFAIEYQTPSQSPPAVLVAQDAFVQIITNFVDNALKFSANAEQKRIVVGYRVAERAEFFVRDFGPGIDAKQTAKIFELFYRVEDELTRKTSGTGIGLALVKELAASMNATVSVVNRQPGAEFVVSLAIAALETD